MPYNYRQLDNHASATKKSGTFTASGYMKNSSIGDKQNKNYTVRPKSDKAGK